MIIKLEKRLQPSKGWTTITPFLAVIATLVAGGFMFFFLGQDPLEAIRIIFWDPLFNPQYASYARPQILVKAGPLILIALGLALGFRANIWNIGAEGQYIMGAIFGAGVALAFYPLQAWFIFPLMIISGAFGGAIWAMIPAILKIRFNTNEILVSLMLTYVAILLLSAMVYGPLKDPDGFNFPESRLFHNSGILPVILHGTRAHIGFLIALFLVVIMHFLLTKEVISNIPEHRQKLVC